MYKIGSDNVYKINEQIEVRYLSHNKVSGLTDLYLVVTDPNGVDSSPTLMTEIVPGLYKGFFTPTSVGYWNVMAYSVSSPINVYNQSFFIVENYPTWVTTNTSYLTDFQYAEDITESSTTAVTTQNKLTYTFTPEVDITGEYLIEWYLELSNSNANTDFYTVQLNGNNLGFAQINLPLTYADNGWVSVSGFQKQTLNNTSQTITINFWASTKTAYIKNARLKIYRVG